AIATRCGTWKAGSQTALAQQQLVDNDKIFLGANTDVLLGKADRMPDGCHFSQSGQEKTAKSYAEAIRARRMLNDLETTGLVEQTAGKGPGVRSKALENRAD